MAEVYSHSKLWLFENCPEAYKVKYIDKAWPDVPKSIELFLGSMVHESLEWLYHVVKDRAIELDDLIKHYADNWVAQFDPEIRIGNGGGTARDYFNKGVKFLIDYYQKNKPFVENTVDIEKKVLFDLDKNGEYKIQGYIDRIVLNENGEYEVHDYKTNKFPKTQKQADKDRQLALYHIGLKNLFGSNIKVKLVWHFLSHNIKVVSQRTDEQLEKLKQEILDLIGKIKSETEWRNCGKAWCDWCEYKRKRELQEENNVSFKNQGLNKYFVG